jgi:hypothetical protein
LRRVEQRLFLEPDVIGDNLSERSQIAGAVCTDSDKCPQLVLLADGRGGYWLAALPFWRSGRSGSGMVPVNLGKPWANFCGQPSRFFGQPDSCCSLYVYRQFLRQGSFGTACYGLAMREVVVGSLSVCDPERTAISD